MAEKKSKKKLQDEIKESAGNIWLAGLGALRVAEQEGSRLFNTLVEEGQKFSERSGEEADKAKARAREAGEKARSGVEEGWSRIEQGVDRAVTETLGAMGVPTRSEVEALSRRIEELTVAVERLRARPAPASSTEAGAAKGPKKTAGKPSAKKAATKRAATKKASAKKTAAKKPAGKKKPDPSSGS